MILLSSTDTPLYRIYQNRHPLLFGYFVSIRKRGIPSFIKSQTAPWAADNECFNGKFDPASFILWLLLLRAYNNLCLFVTVPDVVGDAYSTLIQYPFWRTIIHGLGFRTGLALQDGVTPDMVPWSMCDAVFVGGTTNWKLSQDVIALLEIAQKHHKWRHIGRVNSFVRMMHFWDYADSFDGTGFAIEPDGKLLKFTPQMRMRRMQRRLF